VRCGVEVQESGQGSTRGGEPNSDLTSKKNFSNNKVATHPHFTIKQKPSNKDIAGGSESDLSPSDIDSQGVTVIRKNIIKVTDQSSVVAFPEGLGGVRDGRVLPDEQREWESRRGRGSERGGREKNLC